MKVRRITDTEVSRRLKQPYNPPANTDYDDETACEAFSTEYFAVQKKVDDCLSRFGKRDDFGYADYCLCTDWSFSRGISITVTKSGFVTESLLATLAQLLCELNQDYELYITHFSTDAMVDEPRWDTFVNRNECSVFADSLRYFPGLEAVAEQPQK